MLIAIIVAVFAACFLLALAIGSLLAVRRDPVRQRLEQLAGGEGAPRSPQIQKGVNLLTSSVQSLTGTRERLSRAGYLHASAAYDYYLVTLILALVFGLIAAAAGLALHLAMAEAILLTLAAAGAGVLVPWFYVSRRLAKRREAIRMATPNMLDLLVVCVEAGLSFTAGIQKLAEEMKRGCPELAQELKIVTHEVLIGKPKADVLRMLAHRTQVEELRSLAVTLIQTDRLGTSLGTSLRVLAESMRFKRRQRAEEAANKVSVKLVFPLVLLIFPELLIVLVGPAMINVFKSLQDVVR